MWRDLELPQVLLRNVTPQNATIYTLACLEDGFSVDQGGHASLEGHASGRQVGSGRATCKPEHSSKRLESTAPARSPTWNQCRAPPHCCGKQRCFGLGSR